MARMRKDNRSVLIGCLRVVIRCYRCVVKKTVVQNLFHPLEVLLPGGYLVGRDKSPGDPLFQLTLNNAPEQLPAFGLSKVGSEER